MTDASYASVSSLKPSLPVSTAAGVVTSANTHVGFRSPANAMASLPRLLVKMATFGYIDTGLSSFNSSLSSVDAITTNASSNLAGTDSFAQQGNSSGGAGNAEAASAAAVAGETATEGFKGVGNVFTYVTSRWAVLCLFMTILLNRTMIYASLRRPIRLPFKIRVTMRIVPILMFLHQIFHLLFAMRCQSSAVYMGESKANSETTEFFFRAVGKAGSWWLDDRAVCESIGMIPDNDWINLASTIQNTQSPEIDIPTPKGSLDLLWPLYKTLSLSQFVEVFSCALTGRIPAAETGMTLLEHSLAFAEAEALAIRKTYHLETEPSEDDESGVVKILKVKGEKIVPPEVLYIALISSLSHVTSHTMAILNKQSKYRLISTGFFGIAFLGGFALALVKGGSMGILDFPTVSVVGFIPHLLIFAGILVCAFIYSLALILSSMFPPSGRRGFTEGFNNLRANLTLSSVSVSLSEDFYTTLLKLGFMCLTAASEATYLNEGRAVRVPRWTWLEGEHSKFLDSQRSVLGKGKAGEYLPTGNGVGPYAKERKNFNGVVNDGTGKSKRRNGGAGKWIGAGEMLRGVGVVLGRWGLHSTYRLFRPAPPVCSSTSQAASEDAIEQQLRDEMEANAYSSGDYNYTHFLSGGTLPDIDESADFIPSSATPSDSEASDSEFGDDNTTPTASPGRRGTRQTSVAPEDGNYLTDLFETPQHLASLLDPTTPEDRASARLLARHLKAPHALTRHAYETSSPSLSGPIEESVLESILLTRRRRRRQQPKEDEEDGGGEEEEEEEEKDEGNGPVCVVCQCAQRTILVWPCRCLSLCEDCRVCLAMNNFANCVTCRQTSEGFSRIYIP